MLQFFLSSNGGLQWGMAATALLLLCVSGWLYLSRLQLGQQAQQAQAHLLDLQKREAELQAQIAQQKSTQEEASKELQRVREQGAALELQKKSEQQIAKHDPLPERLPKIVNFKLAPQTRGIEQPATLKIPTDATAAVFSLRLDPTESKTFQIVLRSNADNKIIWQSGKRTAKGTDDLRRLIFGVPANVFTAQNYTFTVSANAADGSQEPLSNYGFRVVR